MKKPRKKLRCRVCGWKWESRKVEGNPVKCPNQKCQSVDWNK